MTSTAIELILGNTRPEIFWHIYIYIYIYERNMINMLIDGWIING